MAATDPKPSQPRRFAISLPQPLWIAVAAGVLIVAGVGVRIATTIYRQRVTIREIERLNAYVGTNSRGPAWLRDRVGDEWMKLFDDVVEVNLTLTDTTDATLRQVCRLSGVRRLNLNTTEVTDAGLANLKGLTSLERLTLSNTQITDAGLAEFEGLTSLERLWLYNTQISDAGLVHLKGLTKLEQLFISSPRVTDVGVAELQLALPGLTINGPDDTPIQR